MKIVEKVDLTHGLFFMEGFQGCFCFVYRELVMQYSPVIAYSEGGVCHSEPSTKCEGTDVSIVDD
jgi:hypothetical protein